MFPSLPHPTSLQQKHDYYKDGDRVALCGFLGCGMQEALCDGRYWLVMLQKIRVIKSLSYIQSQLDFSGPFLCYLLTLTLLRVTAWARVIHCPRHTRSAGNPIAHHIHRRNNTHLDPPSQAPL
jgi:hypothetical protein